MDKAEISKIVIIIINVFFTFIYPLTFINHLYYLVKYISG